MSKPIGVQEEQHTKRMINMPVTYIRKLIGRKWFLSPELLAKRAGVGLEAVINGITGQTLPSKVEKKLRTYLENYKGEMQ